MWARAGAAARGGSGDAPAPAGAEPPAGRPPTGMRRGGVDRPGPSSHDELRCPRLPAPVPPPGAARCRGMIPPAMAHHAAPRCGNRLLAALPDDEFRALAPLLAQVIQPGATPAVQRRVAAARAQR